MCILLLSKLVSYKQRSIMFIIKYDQGKHLSSEDIEVSADNFSS
jgi:hypothetical protein